MTQRQIALPWMLSQGLATLDATVTPDHGGGRPFVCPSGKPKGGHDGISRTRT